MKLHGLRIGVAAVAVAAVALVAPGAASATAEQGLLLIHGVGTAYASTAAVSSVFVSNVATAGGSVTYSFEVKNTGQSPAQYLLFADEVNDICPFGCTAPVVTVKAGTVGGTLAMGPNGYYTDPILAGSVATYSLTVKLTKDPSHYDEHWVEIDLDDTAGNLLGSALAITEVTGAKDDSAYDTVMTAPSEKSISSVNPNVTDLATYVPAAMKINTSVALTVKLLNDSSLTQPVYYLFQLDNESQCAAQAYPWTAKTGSFADVTAGVAAGTYHTQPLGPGKSETLTLTIKYTGSGECPRFPAQFLSSSSDGFGDHRDIDVITNPSF
jgi:uncharacterized repeat protein (TIGR01451 family)